MLDLKIPPLLVAALCAGLMAAVTVALPMLAIALPANVSIAIALASLGAAIAAAGVIEFRRRRTTVNPLTPEAAAGVVSTGIYRYSRNPMYLGFALVLAGFAAYLANLAAFALLPLFVAYLNAFQIGPEERALLAKFGPDFAAYMARVRRWL